LENQEEIGAEVFSGHAMQEHLSVAGEEKDCVRDAQKCPSFI